MERTLSYRVSREPENLLSHVQRIRYACYAGSESVLGEAMGDLFIALGSKGVGLRAKMLKKYGQNLSREWKAILYGNFISGINKHTPLPARSRLTRGVSGRDDFVVRREEIKVESAEEENRPIPNEKALDHINGGRLDDACQILEELLHETDDPHWEANAMEIVALYRYVDGGEKRFYALQSDIQRLSPLKAEYLMRFFTRGDAF